MVNQARPTTALRRSANPSVFGQSVTFTATVTATAPAAGTPTRDGDVQGRRDDARHRHAERLGVATFARAACRSATTRSRRSTAATPTSRPAPRRRSTRRSTRRDHDRADVVGQPVGVRSVGDVHRDGHAVSRRRRHADRDGDVLGRRDDARHRHAERRRHRDLRHRRACRWPRTRSPRSTAATATSTTSHLAGLSQVGQPGRRPRPR